MAISTRVLLFVEPKASPAELGVFNLPAAPSPEDVLTLPNQPLLRVTWRRFLGVVSDDGVQLVLACVYQTLQPALAENTSLDVVEDQQDRINSKLRENQKVIAEIQGRSFKDATAYANVIIVAGFAAIFAIWSNTKASMTPVESAIIAALVLFALVVFVAFEIIKMIVSAVVMRQTARPATRDPLAPDYLEKLVEAEKSATQKLGVFIRAWPIFLFLALSPMLVAVGFLFWKFYTIISAVPPAA